MKSAAGEQPSPPLSRPAPRETPSRCPQGPGGRGEDNRREGAARGTLAA
jgi:hypothetical protein